MIDELHALGLAFDDRTQAAFTGLQRVFGAAAIGDIEGHTGYATNRAGCVSERFHPRAECAPAHTDLISSWGPSQGGLVCLDHARDFRGVFDRISDAEPFVRCGRRVKQRQSTPAP